MEDDADYGWDEYEDVEDLSDEHEVLDNINRYNDVKNEKRGSYYE